MGLLAKASVAIDGSKFKAVNSRDNNFTKGKMERRLAHVRQAPRNRTSRTSANHFMGSRPGNRPRRPRH
jgi:hypothetical protein